MTFSCLKSELQPKTYFMKRLLLFQFILFISFSVNLHAQCGPGEDTVAPIIGNGGDGTMANPFKNLLQSTVGSVPSGTYYFNFNGSTFQGELDNDTDGGGWLMILNYVHLAGDNSDLTIRNTDLPLLGSSTLTDNEAGTVNWGHMGNALAADIDFEEVRFYGETTGHNRVIDFKTSYINVLNYLKTGSGNFAGIQAPFNHTTLPGHSANIPGQAFNIFSNQGNLASTEFPFWRSGQFHWGIRGLGNRWEVDDAAGNTQSTIHRIWVRGDQSPLGTTTISVTLDNTGNITVNPSDFGLGAADNCSSEANITLSLSQTDFTCADLGDNTIQLTATDEQNNSTVIDVVVTIAESPPIITTPQGSVTLELDSNGLATIDLAALNISVTDDCAIDTITLSQTEFTCNETGFQSFVISAADVSGNTTNRSVILNVVDNIVPVVQCIPSFSVELDATGTASIEASDLVESFSDNCSTANTFTLDKTDFTCADIGDNTVTLTVRDPSGNEATCSTTVTITVPSCPGNQTIESDFTSCGVVYNYPCASNITAGPVSGTLLDVGTTTTFTYDTLDNMGATVACSYNVTITDTQGPLFTTPDQTFELGGDGMLTLTADDFLGPDPLARDYTIDQSGTLDRVDVSATGTIVDLEDDEVSSALPIGFDFAFYGDTYSEFYISSNGFITFTANSGSGCCNGQSLPDLSTPNNLIAFDWNDINPQDGGTMRYETIGTAPNRILIMDWDSVTHIDDDTDITTTQIKLFEISNRIEIHTTNIPLTGDDKTQGLENIDGTEAVVVPGRNASQWSATNDVVAFIPIPGIVDGCGVNTLVASQTTFNCEDVGDVMVTVTATDVNSNVSEHTATITITAPNGYCNELPVEVKVMLQGATINPKVGEELFMRDDLRVNNLIPTTSPYADAKTIDSALLTTTGDDAIVDWIWVEIRDGGDATSIIQGQSALLLRSGAIVSAEDGSSPVIFNRLSGDYYLAVKHRNHLGVMTANTYGLDNTVTALDFTDVNNQITFGTDAQTTFGMPAGIIGMWSGNVNNDAIVQYSGTSPDAPVILSTVLNDSGNFLNFPTYIVNGYNANDVNMNGETQYSGTSPDTPFILQNVLAHPGNFLNFSTYQIQEQLPEN